ncbi:MAG: TIGR02147 family protein [Bacteriovoracaceae bacterium]|nr:TIGR02147 family protein [Bacteriovoracaceae bacterium]
MKRAAKPSPYDFKDYREYLAALISWYKIKGISMRGIASKLDVSVALVSSIIQGRRNLTAEQLHSWSSYFEWNVSEISFLEKLLHFQNGEDRDQKELAFRKIVKFKKYKERSTQEVVTWRYLEKWYVVVIREMSAMKDFVENPDWIRKKLKYPVAIEEIRKALSFLIENKLLARQGDFLHLDCHGGVYKLALASFHNQMLERASDSIYKTQTEERHILGHTFRISRKKMSALKKIMDRALDEISQLGEDVGSEGEVYHVALTAAPMTKKEG